MNIEAFLLCDAATDYGGKLNVLGSFDTIFVKEFPAVHQHCAVAIRIRFEKFEAGHHRVRLSFVNADGKPILPPLEGEIQIRTRDGDASVCANLVLNIGNVKFEKAGVYSIDFAIDGKHEKSLPLFLKQVPQKAQN